MGDRGAYKRSVSPPVLQERAKRVLTCMCFGDDRAVVRRRPLTRSKTGDLGWNEYADDAAGLNMLTADSIPCRASGDPRRGKACGIWYGLGVLELEGPNWDPAQGSPIEVCALEGGKEKV